MTVALTSPRGGRALAARISGLAGARRLLAAFGVGVLGALAMPPFDLWPVLILSFGVIVLLLDGIDGPPLRAVRTAGVIGWWFGFGYFLASLWWIGAAFLVDADVFAWLLPFAVTALPAGLAIFMAAGAMAARLLWSRGPGRIFAFAFAFTISEWLRGNVLTGFPWNTFGYAFSGSLPLLQPASVIGLWGLTFLALLVLAAPVLLLRPTRLNLAVAALAALALAGAYGWGEARLAANPTTFVDGVRLRIMQPNLPQDKKFAYDRRQEILKGYLDLSVRPTATHPQGLSPGTLLIWPESALPFIYEREPWAAAAVKAALPDDVTLVAGAVRYGAPPRGSASPFFNAIRVIDRNGVVLQSTDKVHLVPFGEYLPFQAALESIGLEQLTRVRGGFSAGERLTTLRIPGAPDAAPLVCYEAIFPGEVVPGDGPRPGFLLNLTNDGWFGITPGPYQHFAQARLRAVEEGLPLVRAANTGISAIVDPVGRIVASTPLGKEDLIDSVLPYGTKLIPPAAGGASLHVLGMLVTAFAVALWGHLNVSARKS